MSQVFGASELIPKERVIISAGSHLYRIGLSPYKTRKIERNMFFKPIIIFIVLLLQLIRSLVLIVLPEKSHTFHAFMGDFAHFMGIRIQCHIALALLHIQAMVSQIIFLVNYMNQTKPTDLRIFDVMSGLMTPQSMGLIDKKIVFKLNLMFKRVIIFGNQYNRFIPIQVFLVVFISFYSNLSTIDLFIYGLPNTIIFIFTGIYTCQILLWQFIYFYLIVYYLNAKLNIVNNEMKRLSNLTTLHLNKNYYNNKIFVLIKQLNDIYLEISEYNSNYWSKYLCNIWITLSVIIATTSYSLIFTHIVFYLRIGLLLFSTRFAVIAFNHFIHNRCVRLIGDTQ